MTLESSERMVYLDLPTHVVAGRTVVVRDQPFCPNGESARTTPDAPDRSPYPDSCSDNPFTLGAVWGIQQGWATATGDDDSVKLTTGKYTATINKAYRDSFGIPASQATAVIKLTVRPGRPGSRPCRRDRSRTCARCRPGRSASTTVRRAAATGHR